MENYEYQVNSKLMKNGNILQYFHFFYIYICIFRLKGEENEIENAVK